MPRSIKWIFVDGGILKPQALDGANDSTDYGIWGIFAAICSYVVYAVVKDLHVLTIQSACNNTNSTINENATNGGETQYANVSPQAEEVNNEQKVSLGDSNLSSQNVTFKDTHPGYLLSTDTQFDSVRDGPLIQDATLDEFFSRPLRIASFDWGVSTTLFQNFNPWTLYFQNPRVINRISNYKLMRAKLHVKVLINGNAFHYGRAIMAYNPLHTLDEMTVTRAFLDVDVVGASQRPHIYLDPTNSQGGELCLPFVYYKNLIDIVDQDWQEMGAMNLHGIQTLKHANGAVDSVTISVFAWATDVRFAIPTQAEPGSILPQAEEYGQGAISKPASIIANIASKLTTVPVIGMYARATQIGAEAVGAMASLFGYSRPVQLESSVFKPMTKNQMAVTVGDDDVVKLTVDPKQELTVDSRTVGLTGEDEMTILSIATRESYLTQFDWAVGTNQETLLWNAVVDPCLHRIQSSELHFPASAFATLPFDYWRGTMKFRFQVVCSKYHKGRLKVVYDPNNTPLGGAEYNTAYTTVVDIADTTDFTISCGWGQPTSYRQHIGLPTTEAAMFATTALTYTANTLDYGNGTIAVYVVNELTVPDSTINNDISINVFISMGDDFEVAQPDGDLVSRLRLTLPQGEEVYPQALEAPPEEHERMDSRPYKPPEIASRAMTLPTDDMTNYIHFGESIRSFRTMLKRYNLHEIGPILLAQASGAHLLSTRARQSLPFEPGYAATSGTVTHTLLGGDYAYAQMTLMRYLSTAYIGWRGSVRWLYDFSTVAAVERPTTIVVGREANPGANLNAEEVIGDMATPAVQALVHSVYRDVNGQQGCAIANLDVNPVISFEVPYYSEYRFSPAKEVVKFDGSLALGMPYYDVKFRLNTNGLVSQYYSWCAAGEDFNLYYFVGCPIFYFETTYPSS